MRKLLITTDNFLPRWDGIARFLSEIIPKLSENYEITVLAPHFKGHTPEFKNVEIIRLPTYNFQIGDFPPAKLHFKKIKKLVKDADIVWSQTIGPIGYLAIKYGKRFKKPVIAYTHSLEWELVSEACSSIRIIKLLVKFIMKRLARKTYNRCDLLLVPSRETADVFNKAKIVTPKTIIKMGINLDKFKPSENKTRAKEFLKFDPKNIIMGFVGRIGREKDLKTLYRAFIQLSDQQNLKLLIIGSGIESQKKLFEERKNIIATGSIDDVIPYLQAMDIYVLPSLTETTSLSTMEAMACGVAVVSTKVGSIENYLKNKFNGLFFPKGNSYVLRKKLEYLIEDESLRHRLGINARKTIMKAYSWSKTVELIDAALSRF